MHRAYTRASISKLARHARKSDKKTGFAYLMALSEGQKQDLEGFGSKIVLSLKRGALF